MPRPFRSVNSHSFVLNIGVLDDQAPLHVVGAIDALGVVEGTGVDQFGFATDHHQVVDAQVVRLVAPDTDAGLVPDQEIVNRARVALRRFPESAEPPICHAVHGGPIHLVS